jgi:hypothetical protein
VSAATNRTDLIAVIEKEYAKLRALIDPISEETALVTDVEGWSIRDVIAHRTHWSGLFLAWKEGGKAGHDVQTPAPGYKWNQLKAYNATVIAAAVDRGWDVVRADLHTAHARMMAYLQEADDAELYTPGLYPWMNTWTLGRWAEAAGSSHYRSAAKAIRKMLRDQA